MMMTKKTQLYLGIALVGVGAYMLYTKGTKSFINPTPKGTFSADDCISKPLRPGETINASVGSTLEVPGKTGKYTIMRNSGGRVVMCKNPRFN